MTERKRNEIKITEYRKLPIGTSRRRRRRKIEIQQQQQQLKLQQKILPNIHMNSAMLIHFDTTEILYRVKHWRFHDVRHEMEKEEVSKKRRKKKITKHIGKCTRICMSNILNSKMANGVQWKLINNISLKSYKKHGRFSMNPSAFFALNTNFALYSYFKFIYSFHLV